LAWLKGASAAEILQIDAIALDPSLHLGPSFTQRLRNGGHVSRVSMQKRPDLLAPFAVVLGQSLLFAVFRDASEPLPGLLCRQSPNGLWKVPELDRSGPRQQPRRQKVLLQFPDVERPGVREQGARRVVGELHVSRALRHLSLEQPTDQQSKIFAALPKRRQRQGKTGDARQQVAAKLA